MKRQMFEAFLFLIAGHLEALSQFLLLGEHEPCLHKDDHDFDAV